MTSSNPDPRGSIQREIHYVQGQRSADAARPRGKKTVLGLAAVAVLGALAYFMPKYGWGPGGTDANPGNTERTTLQPAATGAQAQPANALQPAQTAKVERPLRVVTDGDNYLVNGKPMDLAAVMKLAASVPAGAGPEVEVECKPTSRVKTEERLKEALKDAHLTSSWPASLN